MAAENGLHIGWVLEMNEVERQKPTVWFWILLVLDGALRVSPVVLMFVLGVRPKEALITAIIVLGYLAFVTPSLILRMLITLQTNSADDAGRKHIMFVVYRAQLAVMLCVLVAAMVTKLTIVAIVLAVLMFVPGLFTLLLWPGRGE